MKILVTGGAGYIGINTSLHLLKGNHEIFIVDNLSNSHLQSIKRLKKLSQKNFLFSKTDLREEKKLEKIFSKFKPDAVMHFAGLKSVEESMSSPIDYFDANVTGSIKLLNCMNKFNCKKIVFSSSATVYGHPKYLPLDENHPKSPINTYGKTKLMIEDILKDWAKSRKKACVLRYFNPIGAHHSGNLGEHPQGRPSNLIPFLTLVASGKVDRLNIFGDDFNTRDGTGERDYVHVQDLASAHTISIEKINKLDNFEVFNVGTGRGYTVQELVDLFQKVNNKKISFKIVKRREGDVDSSIASVEKINKKLSWKANLSIEDALSSAWKWQINNPKGYLT